MEVHTSHGSLARLTPSSDCTGHIRPFGHRISQTGFQRLLTVSQKHQYGAWRYHRLRVHKPFVSGVDCVIHAAGEDSCCRDPASQYPGTKHLADQAVEAGVKRFIYVSALPRKGRRNQEPIVPTGMSNQSMNTARASSPQNDSTQSCHP